MLLQAKVVYIPADPEREADLNEWGHLGVKTRAAFGRAACEAGDPDHDVSDDPKTSATDTIANVLHYLMEGYGEAMPDPMVVLQSALAHFEEECRA